MSNTQVLRAAKDCGFIYTIRCWLNGRVYVGQTTYSLRDRWKRHMRRAYEGSKAPLHVDLLKFGPEEFNFQQIAFIQGIEKLNAAETYLINLFDSRNPINGYNVLVGKKSGH